jgi:hypothetical protein
VSRSLAEKGLTCSELKRVGEVPHIFSHINMKYVVYSASYAGTHTATAGTYKKVTAEDEFLKFGNYLCNL